MATQDKTGNCECVEEACQCNGKMNGVDYTADGAPTIHGLLVLQANECIVSLGEDGVGYIIARSDDIISHDILLEDTTDDCNFNMNWDDNLLVGTYKLKVSPWSNGEDDAGIDVLSVEPLWTVPHEHPKPPFENGDLDHKAVADRHSPIVHGPAETMIILLSARRNNEWRVVYSPKHPNYKVPQILYNGEWYTICRTDLYDHVATLYVGGRNEDEFWADPLARFAHKMSYGMRIDHEDKTLYVVDSLSDG